MTTDAAGAPQEIRWRGDRLRLARADGPERLSGDWWQPIPYARDYWRCRGVAAAPGTLLCYRDATGWWLQGWDD